MVAEVFRHQERFAQSTPCRDLPQNVVGLALVLIVAHGLFSVS